MGNEPSRRAVIAAASGPIGVGAATWWSSATPAGAATVAPTSVLAVHLAVKPGLRSSEVAAMLTAERLWSSVPAGALVWTESDRTLFQADTTRRELRSVDVQPRSAGSIAHVTSTYDPARPADGFDQRHLFLEFAPVAGTSQLTLVTPGGTWNRWTGVDLMAAVPNVAIAVRPGIDRVGLESKLAATGPGRP